MKVRVEMPENEYEVDFAGPASELMQKLDVNSEEVIVVRNGEVVSEDTVLENSDEVRFLSVVSGG